MSANTAGLNVISAAVAEHNPSKVFAMFSGGHDSVTSTHIAAQHPAFSGVVHINQFSPLTAGAVGSGRGFPAASGPQQINMVDGYWLAVTRADPRAFGLYRRHYSAQKNLPYRRKGNTNVAGPAETLVLLSSCCRALFVWIRNTITRWDGQIGVNCTVFRNEGAGLSSDLIREADEHAWRRWPGERHWTYVDGAKTKRRRSKHAQPGQCFREAGWIECGASAEGLTILERLP